MPQQPDLRTERLLLRSFNLTDAQEVQRLAGNRDIASTTLNIPHPYEDGMAEDWIGSHRQQFEKGEGVVFAITPLGSGQLIGAIGLVILKDRDRAELGYWIGKPFWDNGYATEAAMVVLTYGFGELNLNRIHASHLVRNPSSGRVMEKIGMRYEGCFRQHVKKWGVYEDLNFYAILRQEYREIGSGADL